MFVDIAQLGLVEVGAVVVGRQEWYLYKATLDGVDQAEVAHHPRKEGIGFIAGAFQIIRRSREVVDILYAVAEELHLSQTLIPHHSLCVLLLALLSLLVALFAICGFRKVTMVCLIVDNHNAFAFHVASQHSRNDAAERFFVVAFLHLARNGVENHLAIEGT